MPNNMVEQVARALCEWAGEKPDQLVYRGPFAVTMLGSPIIPAYEAVPAWKAWQGMAVAAIKAMRNPTAEMVAAGAIKLHGIEHPPGSGYTVGHQLYLSENQVTIYQRMNDAALRVEAEPAMP